MSQGRILITGGAGFLGYNLALNLAAAGWTIRLFDVNPPGFPLDAGWEFIPGDVRERDQVEAAASGCDVVVDNAALVPVTRATPAQFHAVNVEGCEITLACARAAGAYAVHVSSSAIYGIPRSVPVFEDTPLRPFEPYGRSKADAEEVVVHAREGGQAVAGLRARALLGIGRLGLFDIIFNRVRAGRRVPMFGRGAAHIQMCDARDFASAVVSCIDQQASGDYNVGAAEFGTVRADLEELIRRVGSRSRLLPVPQVLVRAFLEAAGAAGLSPFTAWHIHSSGTEFWCALDKAERELGWRPAYSNVDAMLNAYQHYVAGDAGWSAHSKPLGGRLAGLLRGQSDPAHEPREGGG